MGQIDLWTGAQIAARWAKAREVNDGLRALFLPPHGRPLRIIAEAIRAKGHKLSHEGVAGVLKATGVRAVPTGKARSGSNTVGSAGVEPANKIGGVADFEGIRANIPFVPLAFRGCETRTTEDAHARATALLGL